MCSCETEATILHADLDAFFASVEQRDDPRLSGRAVIVGMGVVLACSYEAKAKGVHSAMGGRVARRLCPEAVVVKPRFSAYVDASRAVFAVFEDTTPLVEGLSIDEAFLDVRGMERIAGSPEEIAVKLRREVRERVGLPITVGVARTKFLAKVASAVAKPDGLLVVPPGEELAFLHPLPIERLWGVGPKTAAKLRDRNIATVGQVAQLGERTLVTLVGRAAGRQLYALANNRDPRRVRVGVRRRSMGSQCAIGRGHHPPEKLHAILLAIVDRLARRLRAARRVCRTVDAAPALRRLHARHAVAHHARVDSSYSRDPRDGRGAASGKSGIDRGTRRDVARPLPLEPHRRPHRPARPARRPPPRPRPRARHRPRPLRSLRDHPSRPARPQHRLRDAGPAGLTAPANVNGGWVGRVL